VTLNDEKHRDMVIQAPLPFLFLLS